MHIVVSIGGKRVEVCETHIRIGTEQFGHEDVTGLVWGVTQRETWFGFGSSRNVDKIGIRTRSLDGKIDSIAPADGTGKGFSVAQARLSNCVEYELLCRAAFPPEHGDTHAYRSVIAALQKFTIPVLCNKIATRITSGERYQFGGGSFMDHAFILQKEGITFFSGPTYGTLPGGGHWDGPEEAIATVPYRELKVVADGNRVRLFVNGRSNPLADYDGIRLWNIVSISSLIVVLKSAEPKGGRSNTVSAPMMACKLSDDTYEMLGTLAVTGAASFSKVLLDLAPDVGEETYSLLFTETLTFATALIHLRIQSPGQRWDEPVFLASIGRLQSQFQQFVAIGGIRVKGELVISAQTLRLATLAPEFPHNVWRYTTGNFEGLGVSENHLADFCYVTGSQFETLRKSPVSLATLVFHAMLCALVTSDDDVVRRHLHTELRKAVEDCKDFLVEKIDRLLRQPS